MYMLQMKIADKNSKQLRLNLTRETNGLMKSYRSRASEKPDGEIEVIAEEEKDDLPTS